MEGQLEFLFYVYLITAIILLISLWKIFTKAGKPGWAVIIPIYNLIVLLEIVKKPIWWIILLLIPIVNFVIMIIIYHRLSLSFGKSGGFTAGLIFLPVIFFPVLAFDGSTYTPLPE